MPVETVREASPSGTGVLRSIDSSHSRERRYRGESSALTLACRGSLTSMVSSAG